MSQEATDAVVLIFVGACALMSLAAVVAMLWNDVRDSGKGK